MGRVAKYSLILGLLFFSGLTGYVTGQKISFNEMYQVYKGDTIMRDDFVLRICEAARKKTGQERYHSDLEKLISSAAFTAPGEDDQQLKVARWWKEFGIQCYCPRKRKFPGGNFMRQVFHADFRLFANIIGPGDRLTLDIDLPDPSDGLTLFEYINQQRIAREDHFDNNRGKFQKDKQWQSFIFFFMLFSEYKIK